MELRPYQADIIDKTRRALKVHRRVLVTAPTGAGKTAIASHMLRESAGKGMRAWFVVHRRELVEQTSFTLKRVGVEHGFVAAGFPVQYRKPVTVCGVHTLARRLDRLPEPRLIVWDEAHHCAAGTWQAVADRYPDAWHVGLTATPERLDGKGLSSLFNALVPGPSIRWLIEQGYLAPYRVWSHPAPDLSAIRMRGADYDAADLEAAMDAPHILGDAVQHFLSICPNARAVAFCVSVKHAMHTRDAFRRAGIRAEELDGGCDMGRRKKTIAAFRRGDVQVLTSIDLFGEGFDLPELETAILLRPTASLGLYMQQVGRALRAAPGKAHAIILDHAGNVHRHGPPDEDREWDLRGRQKRKRGVDAVRTKVCPNCFGQTLSGRPICEHCGHEFGAQPRVIEEREGDLVELDVAAQRRARKEEVAKARDRSALERIAAERGYKPGWVDYILRARAERGHRAPINPAGTIRSWKGEPEAVADDAA